MWETRVWSLGWDPWRREWQPTPAVLPGKSHRQRSLVGPQAMGSQKVNTTEQLTHTLPTRSSHRKECESVWEAERGLNVLSRVLVWGSPGLGQGGPAQSWYKPHIFVGWINFLQISSFLKLGLWTPLGHSCPSCCWRCDGQDRSFQRNRPSPGAWPIALSTVCTAAVCLWRFAPRIWATHLLPWLR